LRLTVPTINRTEMTKLVTVSKARDVACLTRDPYREKLGSKFANKVLVQLPNEDSLCVALMAK
jgi:hypothetical protein